jgi:HlyD family secretion protein
MRRLILMAAGTALVVLAVAGGWLFWNHRTASVQTQAADQEQPVRVRVVTPQQGGRERTVSRPGTVHSFQYADLYAKVAGYLRNQVVDIGDTVKRDQVLAEIYAPEVDIEVKQAQADVDKAKAQVQVQTAEVKAAEADVKDAEVKVEQAQADLQNAVAMLKLRKEQYQRVKRLAELKSVEQELADEKMEAQQAAQSKELVQRKAIATAQVAVQTAKAHQAAAEAKLADAKAQVAVREAALSRADVFQAYLKIRAPFDGVVTQRNYHNGDYILEGSSHSNKPVHTIARTDLMRVIVYVPDPDVPYTHRGEPAELRVDSLPGRVFKGTVARTARSEDYNTRTMRTEIDLPNPDDVLVNGMFGSATIYLGRDTHALTIPTACLVGAEKDGKRSVYVVRAGKAHRVPVQVRRDDGIRAEISGLDANVQVVEGHGAGLAEGAPVTAEKGQ